MYPFHAKNANICNKYFKMFGFYWRDVWYPRFQDTDFLQVWLDAQAEEVKVLCSVDFLKNFLGSTSILDLISTVEKSIILTRVAYCWWLGTILRKYWISKNLWIPATQNRKLKISTWRNSFFCCYTMKEDMFEHEP